MKKITSLVFLMSLLLFFGYRSQGQTILTLEKAMEIAVVNSPSIQGTLLNLQRTTESLNAQRAGLKSKFALSVNPIDYSNSRKFDNRTSSWFTNKLINSSGTFRVDQPILATNGKISLVNTFGWQSNTSDATGRPIVNNVFLNNLYLSLSQPLFTYNRTKVALKTLELNNENAQLSYAMQRLALEKTVSQLFYNVYMAQMSLSIRQDENDNTQKSYDIIKNKVDAGLAAKEQLFQAAVNLETAKSSLASARVSLESAKDQFKQYIGMDIFEEISVITDVSVAPIEVDGKKALEHGLATRMELRQRQISIENSQFDLIAIKAQNEFKGDLSLSIGMSGDDPTLKNVYDKPTQSPHYGITFNIPIFDWGQRAAQIRAQNAVVNTQKLNYSNQEIQIKVDIRQVIRNLSNLKDQISIALQNQQNSQLTYDINLERFKNGDLTSMDLNLYQVQLSNNKMAYAQALINYKLELLNLKIQSLYDFTTNQPVIPEQYLKAKNN
ncbi:MAG: TolC family protein [Bacteroidetes bacterium]|nr:TolC family protein [Bacteroidota bacterium]MCL6101971.1 TolC family protein [Bacteroidota bacterium]